MHDFDKNFFADLLRIAQGDRSLNKFAAECGVSSAHLSRLTREMLDTPPSPDTLRKISDSSQGRVSYNDLLIACGFLSPQEVFSPIKDAESPASDLFVSVPVLETIKAGYDLFDDQQVLGHEMLPREWVKEGEHFFLKVTDDSMIDDGIKEGYRVLVRRQKHVDNGKIAVVSINGNEGTLKRVFFQDGMVILQSSNSKVPPEIRKPKQILILGQVIKVEFDLR